MKCAQTCPLAGTIFFLVLSQPGENVHRDRAVYDYQTLEAVARFRSADIEKVPGCMEQEEEETINFPGSPRNSPLHSVPSLTERIEWGMNF